MVFNWLKKKLSRKSANKSSSPPKPLARGNKARLQLETLEDRLTPTSNFYSVTSLAEGAGVLTTAGHAGTQADPYLDTTLRGAIAAATADGGTDTIVFASNLFTSAMQTITLSTVGDGTAGPSDFGITTPITIQGPSGNNGLTLTNSATQRFFYVGTGGNLTLQNLTLTGGNAQGGSSGTGGGAAGMGGAIFNQGTLTVLQSTLSGNTALGGAAGAVGGANGSGGGGLAGAGTAGNGGGPNGGASGGGNGGFGGGGGKSGGFGGFGGGGGANGNGGFGGGGGYYHNGGFGGGSDTANAGIGGGGAGMGGAIFNAAGTVIITNSTLTTNTAQGGATHANSGNGSGFGGALFNLNGSISLTDDTLANNIVAAGSVGSGGSAAGGAVYTLGLSNVVAFVGGQTANIGLANGTAGATLKNTIFANSTGGADIVNNNSSGNSTVSGGNNLGTPEHQLAHRRQRRRPRRR